MTKLPPVSIVHGVTRLILLAAFAASETLAATQPASRPTEATAARIVVHLDQAPKPISPDLLGVFFEDLNYAADGGLYAELIQNRSFDYQPTSNIAWNAFTAWELVQSGRGGGKVNVADTAPIHPNNRTFAVLEVTEPGDGVGIANGGFDGIALKAGEPYEASFFARQHYVGRRWGGRPTDDPATTQPKQGVRGPITVRLEAPDGEVLAEASVALPRAEWSRLAVTLTPKRSVPKARFALLMHVRGGISLDVVSLFPKKTFKDRPNGLRADLAQAIADLKPKFVRFPGGCLVHGNSLSNMYRWKDTIGPIEQRRGQANLWGYHQTVGLGYFEYFQYCEDIGALPLPVVPAGVSCQNADYKGGIGQQALPLDQMPAYIEEVLDLVEYANGPADSEWGAKRAAAGHSEPFNLKYLGVGNEEHITPAFAERFKMIYEAVRTKHPEITVIGTVGPSWRGEDYEKGWALANELKVPVLDEHYYERPEWFLGNTKRYDGYDRAKGKVYLGEYASRGNTLANALAEAAFLTGLERNGDIVQFASYAPLLCKQGYVQWYPDLIYFDNERVQPTVNYAVQKMFGNNAGDAWIPATLSFADGSRADETSGLFFSTVRDSASGDLIVKVVNVKGRQIDATLALAGGPTPEAKATLTLLSGNPSSTNPGDPRSRDNVAEVPMTGETSEIDFGPDTRLTLKPHSLTVVRIKGR